jgi:hypothetical protein
VGTLKAALEEARSQARGNGRPANVGGWLPEHHRWFVERAAWPLIKATLLQAGHAVDESARKGGDAWVSPVG